MPSDKKRSFVNPLTQPSAPPSPSTLPSTDTSTETETSTFTSTYTGDQIEHRKRGKQAFEHTHKRVTFWVNGELNTRFELLAIEQGLAKSTLLNEAIELLLRKYQV